MRSYETVLVERSGGVLRLTMNRPDRLNAVSAQMHNELSELFADVAREDDMDVVVLTGAGRAFSAGGDLANLEQLHADPAHVEATVREARKIIYDLLSIEAPIVAAVNGDAVGFGATLALFCDLVVMSETARIGDPHVRMGLVAGDGGATIWPQLVGLARAKEYLLTGKLIGAVEAERIGLVNYAVPVERFWPTIDELIGQFRELPRRAVRWTKRTLNKRQIDDLNLTMDLSLSLEAQTMGGADFAEAVQAMAEKRRPGFSK